MYVQSRRLPPLPNLLYFIRYRKNITLTNLAITKNSEDSFVWDAKVIKSEENPDISSVYADQRTMWLSSFIASLKPILLLYRTDVEAPKLLQDMPPNQILYVLDKTKTLNLQSAASNATDNRRFLGHCTPIFKTLKGLESTLTDLYMHIFSEISIFGQFSAQKSEKEYLKAILYDQCKQVQLKPALCATYEYLINVEPPKIGRKRRDSLISVFGGSGSKDTTGDKVRMLANHNLDDIMALYHGHKSTNDNLIKLSEYVNKNTKLTQVEITELAQMVSLLVRQNIFHEHNRNLKAQRAGIENVLQAIVADLNDFTISFDATMGKLLAHIVSNQPTCTVQTKLHNQFVCTRQGFVEKADLLDIHTAGHLKHYKFLSAFRLICMDREDGLHYLYNEQIHHIDPADQDRLITADGIQIDKKCLTNGYSRDDHCPDYFSSTPPNVNFIPRYGTTIFTVNNSLYFQSNLGAQLIVNNEKIDIVQPKVISKNDLPVSLIFEKNTYTLAPDDFNERSYENVHTSKLIKSELQFVLDAFHADKLIAPQDPYAKTIAQFNAVLTDASKLWNSSKVFRHATISVSSIVSLILLGGTIILIIFCCRRSDCCKNRFVPPQLPKRPTAPKVSNYHSQSDDSDYDAENQAFHLKHNRRVSRK